MDPLLSALLLSMYVLAALILIVGLIQTEADKQTLPESKWASDEAMIAPGWKA
jgi:hypothetical protein